MINRVHGWLILNKPHGITSALAGSIVRRLLGCKKIGHVGTLDPMATGVLILAVGEATKLINVFEKYSINKKQYEFSVQFGQSTDTLDSTGKIISTTDIVPIHENIVKISKDMLGEQDQVPPVYSAVKIGGKRACDLARKGKPPTLKSRKINIFSLDLVNFNGNEASFVVECSGGTYVRSLAVDIAKKLGTECFVTKIHRTVDRIFKIDDSFSLDFLRKISHKCTIGNLLVPVGKVLGGIPEVPVSVQVLEDVNAGRPFLVCEEAAGCSCSVYDGMVQILCNECVVGLGVIRDGMCFPKRVLNVF